MELKTVLKNIGLSQKEADVYLALLRLKEANLREISDKSGVPRTTLYTTIEYLTSRGFVQTYKLKGRKLYIPSAPEKILQLKKDSIELLEENLEEFRSYMGDSTPRPKIKTLEDREGIRLIFNEILHEKKPILAITCIEDMQKIANDYFDDFITKRVKQNLPVKLITVRSPESQEMRDTDDKFKRQTRFLPSEYRFNTANYIFGDKIALLSLKQEPPVGVVIEDKGTADTHRMYFDLVWKNATIK